MKISIITATFNAAHTLSDSLRSVGSQTHPCIEHLVIDGASRDGTQALVNAHRDTVSVFVSEPDKGIYDALNKGLTLATGDVLGFLHADDVFANTSVLAIVAQAFNDPAVEAVYGDLNYVDKNDLGRVIRYWRAGAPQPGQWKRGWMPPHPTFFARRSVYQRLGLFDTRYRIAADYDCLVRFLHVAAVRTVYIPRVLVCMRVGGASNRSLRNLLNKSMEDLDIIRRHGLGGAWALLSKNLSKLPQYWLR